MALTLLLSRARAPQSPPRPGTPTRSHCQPLSGDWQAARSSGITHSGNKGRGRLAAEGDRAEGLPPKARTRRSSSGRSTPRGHGGRCQQGHRAQLARREVELGLPGLLRRFSPSSESTAGPDPPLVAPSRLAGMDPTQGSWSPTARRETSWGEGRMAAGRVCCMERGWPARRPMMSSWRSTRRRPRQSCTGQPEGNRSRWRPTSTTT